MRDYIERKAAVSRFEELKEQADTLRDKLYLDGVLAVIDALPTAEPETMPIVQQLRAEIADLKEQLHHLEYWQLNRKIVLESAAQDRAAVNVMHKHCEKTTAELREKLKRVTAERDAAIKDRAELADFELTVCEQFCFGDRKRDIPPFEWNRFGKCQLREWRGLVAENATTESEAQPNDRP